MKIKIIFFLATLNGGGAERVTTTIIRGLDREIFDIYLVLVSKEGEFLELIPSYVNIVELKSKKTIFSIFKLIRVIQNIKPHIIYSTLFRTHIAIEFALKGLRDKPKRVYRSPTSPKILIQRGEMGIFTRYLLNIAYSKADIVLAQTPQMREEIAKYHNIDKKRIRVFINPLDTKFIDQQIRYSINPFNNSFINIVSAGRLSEVKGFDILLYAFRKVLNKRDSNFFLHIIGRDAGELNSLLTLAKELSISHRVKFWGFQENPYQFFYHSDMFVLSSRREGLPNAVLENLYLGKPVIATKCIPFMSELIKDEVNGFLVDVGDIDSLAQAILNYKELNIDRAISIDDNSLDINSIFKELK